VVSLQSDENLDFMPFCAVWTLSLRSTRNMAGWEPAWVCDISCRLRAMSTCEEDIIGLDLDRKARTVRD
jgi:hypothetical protein